MRTFFQTMLTMKDICGNLSGIFSGILAYAFDLASGKGGLSGWQWLMLVEAIATIILGTAIWFLLPDCKSQDAHKQIHTLF
jgi:predicted MFS family arabinose efflux permease